MSQLDFFMSNHQNHYFYGVTIGIVTNNKDPEGLGRVKVKFPWLSADEESYWARIVTLMAGNDRGIYFLPEVDDEVLVAFEQGDMNFPYILGALWNGKDKPPGENANGENNQRIIKSRSGHQIILDDTQEKEQIIIQDQTGKNKIVINSQTNQMNIQVEKDLLIQTNGKIILNSSADDISLECKNLSIKTQGNYQLESGADCHIKVKANYELVADLGLGIKCQSGVKINDDSLEVM